LCITILGDCINRILSNVASRPVVACQDMPFVELCSNDTTPVSNYWMISTQPNCTVAYTAVNNSGNQQHLHINNCKVIYRCWIAHNSKSVCLYLDNSSDAVDHNRLTLASMRVQEGVWEFVHHRIAVFVYPRSNRIDSQLPFFTGLHDDTKHGEEIATFVIGNGPWLARVIVWFNGDHPTHRQSPVCARIVDVTVTSHVIVTCVDQTKIAMLPEYWDNFNISLTWLHDLLKSGSSKSYVSDSSEFGMIVITNTTSNATTYWLADQQNPGLEKCVETSATFVDGVPLLEDDNSGMQFFAILDGNLTVVNESCNGLHTIATDVCHSPDCYLSHTEHFLYISDQNRTTVVNIITHQVTALQYDICDVLPVVERARQHCELQEHITPTVTSSIPRTLTISNTTGTGLPTSTAITNNHGTSSSTASSPHTTTPMSTNVVSTQSANDTTTDYIKREIHKNYVFLVVGMIAALCIVAMIAAVIFVSHRLKRRLQHWKKAHFQIRTYTSSFKPHHGLATSGLT